jgi:hypothetical protein
MKFIKINILILSFYLRLDLPTGLYLLGLTFNFYGIPPSFHSSYMPCSSQLSKFNHPDYNE